MKDQKHTMSFKFPSPKLPQKPAPESEKQPPLEILTWDDSPFKKNDGQQIDKQEDEFVPKPDKVIDFSKRQEQKREGNEPFWDDGNRSMGPKLPPKGRKNTFKWSQIPWNVIAAVVSAIIVGLGLGVVMYQLVIGNPSAETSGEQAVPVNAAVAGAEAVSFPTMHSDVVQGAAFDEREKGEQVVLETQQSGVPAVLTSGEDQQFMFVGLAGDQARAQELSELIKEKGQDVYVKTYTVEGGIPEADGELAAAWFTEAHTVFKQLSEWTSVQLVNGGSDAINEQQFVNLQKQLQELKGERDVAFSLIGDDAKPFALAMSDGLTLANTLIQDYSKVGDEESLWAAQQALLQSLVDYERTVEAIRSKKDA